MLIPRSRFADAWNLLRTRCIKSGFPVLVFVTSSVDALCSCRIVTDLLKSDFISFHVYPVSSYTQLQSLFTEVEDTTTWEFAILIELGAKVSLNELLDEQNRKDTAKYLFVWDTHRPYHLCNLDSRDVYLFDRMSQKSWTAFLESLPWVGMEDKSGIVEQPADDTESEEFEDEEDAVAQVVIEDEETDANNPSADWDNESILSTTSEKNAYNILENVSTTCQQILPSPSTEVSRKRQRTQHIALSSSTEQDADQVETSDFEKRKAASVYYAQQYWDSCSTSLLTYVLARDTNQSSLNTLWLAILGLTDHYLDERIDNRAYEAQVSFLQNELKRYQKMTTEQTPLLYLGALSGNNMESVSMQEKENKPTGTEHQQGGIRIIYSLEWKIELMRLWTFYDALMHCSVFVSHFATWRQKGQREVLELLAILGIPLKDAKQSWNHMSMAFFERRRNSTACHHYGLENISFPSFVRVGVNGSCFSAMDMVLCTRALLNFLNGDESVERGFWTAYEALLDSTRLMDGVQKAIQIQRYLVEEAAEVVDRQRMLSCKHFRYIIWKDFPKSCLFHCSVYRQFSILIRETMWMQRNKAFHSTRKPLLFLAKLSENEWKVWLLPTGRGSHHFLLQLQKAISELLLHVKIEQGSFVYRIENGYEKTFLRKLQNA